MAEGIDPDPLGLLTPDGEYDQMLKAAKAGNDNAAAGVGNSLSLGKNQAVTLTAGNYYFTSIALIHSQATLNIDTSGGEVNIFLEGGQSVVQSAEINFSGGAPIDFSIFSNSDAAVEFKNNADFQGLIYAPAAKVYVKNNGDYYGAIWGNEVEFKNGAKLYYDTQMKNKFPGGASASPLKVGSWEQL